VGGAGDVVGYGGGYLFVEHVWDDVFWVQFGFCYVGGDGVGRGDFYFVVDDVGP